MEVQWYPKQDGEDDEQSPYLESLLTSESSPDFKLYFYHLSGRRPAQNLSERIPSSASLAYPAQKLLKKNLLQKIPLSLSVAWRSPLCSYLKPPSQPKKKYLSKKNSKPRRPSLCPSPRKMNLFFLRKCLFPQTKQKLLPPKKISAASLKATTVPAAASHLPLSHTLLITEKCCPLWRSPQVPTIHWLLQKALYDSIVAN